MENNELLQLWKGYDQKLDQLLEIDKREPMRKLWIQPKSASINLLMNQFLRLFWPSSLCHSPVG